MLSDKLKHVPSPRPRNKTSKIRKWYSDSQKLEAVKLWLLTGNIPVTAASLNIPVPTLKEWRYTKWWEEVVAEIKAEGTIQMSNKLKSVAEKALSVTIDRLENGDWIYDQKTGELRRKPVNLRDAMQVANGALDRHLILEKKPVDEKMQQQVQDRLATLANAFADMAKRTRKIEVMDHAIHEKREEGLQKGAVVGENEGHLPSIGSSQESPSAQGNGEIDGGQAIDSSCGPQEGAETGRE